MLIFFSVVITNLCWGICNIFSLTYCYLGNLIESFNSTCLELRYGRTSCSCKFYFTYCYPILRSHFFVCWFDLWSRSRHRVCFLVFSVSSKYFFPEMSFGSHPSPKRTIGSPVALPLAWPHWSSWPGDQSKEEMQGCLFLLLF